MKALLAERSTAGLTDISKGARKRRKIAHQRQAVWNCVGDDIQQQVIDLALTLDEDTTVLSPQRTGSAVHGKEALFRVGSYGLPAVEG